MDPVVQRIMDAAKQKGLDQKTLAFEIGVRPQAITEWKKGVTSSYTKYLPQIAETLGVSVEYLLNGTEPAPSSGQSPTKEEMQAAFWGGEKDLTQEDLDAMWADVENFAAFVAQKRRQEKKND